MFRWSLLGNIDRGQRIADEGFTSNPHSVAKLGPRARNSDKLKPSLTCERTLTGPGSFPHHSPFWRSPSPAPRGPCQGCCALLRICFADFGLDSDTGPAGWQLRNDVVVPVVAQRLCQIVQGGSMKSQKTSLQLSVQARPCPARTDPSETRPDLRQPY